MTEADTKIKLIEIAIDFFGRKGLDAVTTREIADAAGTQQSAISYHFRSKEALYLACAEHIAEYLRIRAAPLFAKALSKPGPLAARSKLEGLVEGLAIIMMRDEIAPLARFVVREQMSPTPAFAVLYDGGMRHIIAAMCGLLGTIAGGRLNPEQLQVRCLALIGQVMAFRFARAALLRVTGWNSVGERETEIVREAIIGHTRAILADLKRGRAK